VCDSDGSSKYSGTDDIYQCTPAQVVSITEIGGHSQVGSSHGCNTSESFSVSEGGMSQNTHSLGESDLDPDHDEYVGFNDEGMYNSDGEDGLDQNHSAKRVAQDVQVDSYQIMVDNVHDEPTVDDTNQCEPLITHDLENLKIKVGALFPDINTFRRALRHFAIKNEFEVVTIKFDKKRFIEKCKESSCLWRIHVFILQDNKIFMMKVLPHEYTCLSTTMVDGKMIFKS
jgi:MuDR family transposase